MLVGGVGCDVANPTFIAAPASVKIVSGDAQTGTVGKQLALPLTVEVTDQAGHTIAGQLVQLSHSVRVSCQDCTAR